MNFPPSWQTSFSNSINILIGPITHELIIPPSDPQPAPAPPLAR